MIFGYKPAQVAKALVGALIAGGGSLAIAAEDGLTLAEGISAAVIALTAFGGVFGTTNEPTL